MKTPAEKDANDKAGVKRMRGLPDRWRGFRDRSHLWQVRTEDATRRRLTAGPLTTSFHGFSPDGRHILFSTRKHDYERRPYSQTTFWELDLESLAVRELFSGVWLDGAS